VESNGGRRKGIDALYVPSSALFIAILLNEASAEAVRLRLVGVKTFALTTAFHQFPQPLIGLHSTC
jgi:hypothetical protein